MQELERSEQMPVTHLITCMYTHTSAWADKLSV